ncbi:hypothetical protein GJAV_G00112090 [Gymnothorax javanicus]|nr:hypothetical protein GJAV_G00112090 [Gymnothorax javanicus]
MQLLLGLILTLTFSISTGEVKVLTMAEGEKVSMDCTLLMSRGADYYFYWYRQYPGSALQYILRRGGQTTVARRMQGRADEVDEGGQRQSRGKERMMARVEVKQGSDKHRAQEAGDT